MNPVTQALLAQLDDPALENFIVNWDALEELLIDVYKAGSADLKQVAAYTRLRANLERSYPAFEGELAPHWRAARIKGQALEADPFRTLIAPAALEEFIGNWPALQTLPAVREALNEMLVARLDATD